MAALLGDVIKCKHTDGRYKYLVKGYNLYFVLLYDSDDDTALLKEGHIDYKDALYRYNHM